jgi:selenocysteine lyase/cysteine desulfurase
MTPLAFSRRVFIRTVAGGVVGGAVLYAFPEDARAKYVLAFDQSVDGEDEAFWEFVRTQFPLTHDITYLNNGTMGVSPFVVIDAVRAEMEEVDRQGRYGGWEAARPKLAALVNASVEEISLTHNVTEGICVVAGGLPLKAGDEVILTDQEHAGNAIPWLARARRDKIVIRYFSPAPEAALTLERISAVINPRTRVIAVPHITCTTGQVLPGAAISRLGRDRGIWVMLDAAHTPGMMPLDVRALGCDFLASCGHKWLLGPKGTGFLYVRRELVEVLEPHWVGGGVDTGWDVRKGTLTLRPDAHRFDFATQSSALYVGLGAAVDFIHHLGEENVSRRGRTLAKRLRAHLEQLGERVEILTPSEEGGYGSVLGFRLKSTPFDMLQQMLLEKHHIITRAVPENGLNSNRLSFHCYNTPAEVDRVADIIRSVA